MHIYVQRPCLASFNIYLVVALNVNNALPSQLELSLSDNVRKYCLFPRDNINLHYHTDQKKRPLYAAYCVFTAIRNVIIIEQWSHCLHQHHQQEASLIFTSRKTDKSNKPAIQMIAT